MITFLRQVAYFFLFLLIAGIGLVSLTAADPAARAVGILTAIILFIALFVMIRAIRRQRDRIADFAGEKAALEVKLEEVRSRFAPVVDIEAEVAKVEANLRDWRRQVEQVRDDYASKRRHYDALMREIAIFDDKLAFAEMGVYAPHFDFTDSEAYKAAIERNYQDQKDIIAHHRAVVCHTEWTVEGSKAKGTVMTNRNIRLTLRAFNAECDAAIANTRWNNANAMEKRIHRAQQQINKLNESNTIEITDRFLSAKLEELRLTHEYREKLKAEREERAEASRAAREEQKLLRDIEKAQEEEAHYEKLLARARKEAASITGPQLDAFTQQIEMLERDLAQAHARLERAEAMAERTRSGFVYIISNIGSFGEGVVKIGLTRRLDPLDRVRELGDASVPFLFDVHAIIYSEDAPALERALHAQFETGRVNIQNFRKEFFRATIEDVEAAVRELAPDAPFFRDIDAQEYRETLARRNAALATVDREASTALPAFI